MFYNPEQISLNVVTIKECDPSAFEAMLNFMYGGKAAKGDFKFAIEVFKLAGRYQIDGLKSRYSKIISSSCPSLENVFDLLEAVKYLQADGQLFANSLESRCRKLMESETNKILKHVDPCRIPSSVVSILLDLPRLNLSSELDLLEWVFIWAKNLCVTTASYYSIREVLEEFLPQLNLIHLDSESFAKLVKKHQDVFSDSECLSIFMNIAIPGSWPLPSWCDANRQRREIVQK
ncbi:hypothetical protein X975_19082, partial [Stegodyphus mimosarum]